MAGKKPAGFLYNAADGTLQSFAGKKDFAAASKANAESHISIGSVEDLGQLSMSQLLNLHNTAVGEDKAVTKFKNKDAAIEATFPVLADYATPVAATEAAPAAAGAKKAPKEKKARAEGSAPGRASSLAGKSITRNQKENPRRPETHGARAWDLVTDGMKVEEYQAALAKASVPGGLKHLQHDMKRGWVTVA